MSTSRPAQNTTVNNNKSSRSPVIPINRLIPCCGLLCCINSFVCQQPECGGCYFRDICCCIQHEVFCCKGTTESGYDCVCYRMECMKGSCQDCCQMERQCLCYDYRCATTQVPEHPCLCTVLFFTCYFDNKQACYCCGNIDQLNHEVNKDQHRATNLQHIIQAQMEGGPSATGNGGGRRTPLPPQQQMYRDDRDNIVEAVAVYD